MTETNKSYRIRTNVGVDTEDYIFVNANLVQDYDAIDILSLSIKSKDTYRLHNADYGVVVGRVIANNGFGVPNAKISIFISADFENGDDINYIYPFQTTSSRNNDDVRYNLLPDEQVSDCHQVVGTFPNKRYLLDNDLLIEVFDTYYKFTTRTNNAGDYMICGVPVGNHTIHMDLDLSDCGILSQRPRDFVYKGYTIEQFENPNQFKTGTTYSSLSQVFTQNQMVDVKPFWGDANNGGNIGITRADINVNFVFEPTCVFLGSAVSDNATQGISKKCIPTDGMGDMDELVTGEGTIEMIRKTNGGDVEEFQIKGTQLINGNGIWCYQIPMNLDYMMTDEYGNMVPTDDPNKGIATRARVRFRISMSDSERNVKNFFRAKALVPHNPQDLKGDNHEDYDYEFGTNTRDESYRDLFWNSVYSVKSYIPRFQKRSVSAWKEDKFTGIKHCNIHGANNPIPYNNIRIKLPFMFVLLCVLVKVFIVVVGAVNNVIVVLGKALAELASATGSKKLYRRMLQMKLTTIDEGLCPDIENWYFAPMSKAFAKKSLMTTDKGHFGLPAYNLMQQTLDSLSDKAEDGTSIDYANGEDDGSSCVTTKTDYLMSCVEMNLAQEYKVINFDFYNDWINGMIYFPRWMRDVRRKITIFGRTIVKSKAKACFDDTSVFAKTRKYTHQCTLPYTATTVDGKQIFSGVKKPDLTKSADIAKNNSLHKNRGVAQVKIFGKNGGICHENTTMKGQKVYYLKPCEWDAENGKKVNLFATDIVLLGSLNTCDLNGVPQAFKHLGSTTYTMPTNLALTNMESNGPLYATEDDTVCSGNGAINNNTDTALGSGIKAVSISRNGLSSELSYYRSAGNEEYEITYDGNEDSDTIAITEAAGVSWNWTGPGQGEISKSQMYYPGGHFLGLSCVNSQTNIKSCINLMRICEAGAGMSQRKETIRSIDGTGKISYSYNVPTGFISGNEILDSDFRTMFATMNQNRLIANRRNLDTGYKYYNFEFVRPVSFDGSFKEMVKGRSNPYNAKVEVSDENLSTYGVSLGNTRKDYDAGEADNTTTKTIEDANIDYYMFRLGLDYDSLRKTNEKQLKKFANVIMKKSMDESALYLPQYENSFYFYFGMSEGETAIDEFNRQFFSECANVSLVDAEPKITIVKDIAMCKGEGSVTFTLHNLDTPYISVTCTDEQGNTTNWLNDVRDNYVFTKTLPFGNYVIKVVDVDENEAFITVKVGTDTVTYDVYGKEFNINSKLNAPHNEYRGGYVDVSNISIDGIDNNTEVSIVAKVDGKEIEETVSNGNARLWLDSGDTKYSLYAKYRCDGSTKDVNIYLEDVLLTDGGGLDLYVGDTSGVYMLYSDTEGMKYNGKSAQDLIRQNGIENDEGDEGKHNAWLYRLSCMNERNSGSTTPHDCMVRAMDGTKVIWGAPQSYNGIYSGSTYFTSADIESIPSGYDLDDDACYYGIFGKTIDSYFATAYDGTNVCGSYVGQYSNGHIVPDAGGVTAEAINDGDPCAYKSNESGEIIFGRYNYSIPDGDGVIYSTYKYTVIDAPFFANYKTVINDGIVIDVDYDEDDKEYGYIANGKNEAKTIMKIYNGLTYNGKFADESFINGKEISISTEDSDLYRYFNVGQNREVIVATSSLTDTVTYDYEIKGGYPEGGKNMVNSIYDSIDDDFCESVFYGIGDAYIGFKFDGNINNDTHYYAIPVSGQSLVRNNGFVETELERNNGTSATYVAFQYVGDEYDDEYFVLSFVKSGKKKYNVSGKVKIVNAVSGSQSSSIVQWNGEIIVKTETNGDWRDCLEDDGWIVVPANVGSEISPIFGKPVVKQEISGDGSGLFFHIDKYATKAYEINEHKCISIDSLGCTGSAVTYLNDFIIVGIKEQIPESNLDGNTRLYKIYSNARPTKSDFFTYSKINVAYDGNTVGDSLTINTATTASFTVTAKGSKGVELDAVVTKKSGSGNLSKTRVNGNDIIFAVTGAGVFEIKIFYKELGESEVSSSAVFTVTSNYNSPTMAITPSAITMPEDDGYEGAVSVSTTFYEDGMYLEVTGNQDWLTVDVTVVGRNDWAINAINRGGHLGEMAIIDVTLMKDNKALDNKSITVTIAQEDAPEDGD